MRREDWIALRAFVFLCLLSFAAACSSDDDDESAQAGADDDLAGNDDNNSDDDDNNDDDDNADDDDDDDNDDDCTPLPDGVYVAKTGDDANPGTPDAPMKTIAAALDAADDDALPVFVAEGVYEEAVTLFGELRGGYRCPGWARDIEAFPTRIESDQPTVVTVKDAVKNGALVEGFTIRLLPPGPCDRAATVLILDGPARLARNIIDHAAPEPTPTRLALGVEVRADAEVTIEENTITGPSAVGPAGDVAIAAGVAIRGSAARVTLRGNRIAAGSATTIIEAISAAVYVDADDVDVFLAHNWAFGGDSLAGVASFSDGVDLAAGDAALVGNVTVGGAARGPNMAISAGVHTGSRARRPLLINNTLVSGATSYAAVAAELESGATLVNNLLATPGSARFALPIVVTALSGPLCLHHNDLWCAAADCWLIGKPGGDDGFRLGSIDDVNRCLWPSCREAEGNLSVDPLLAGLNDQHLQTDSPCIDAGIDPAAWLDWEAVRFDIDGDVRPLGWSWDIGADEVR